MAATPTHRILLAEDEVMTRNLIRELLQNQYELLVAADGSEALELSRAQGGTIDLLLTDVEMPELDGVSLWRQISTERPDSKVLFMSSIAPSQLLPAGSRPPFLAKPFSPDALRRKIKEVLREGPEQQDNPKVLLVVDSNLSRRQRTTQILMGSGYAVLTASSAEDAEAMADTSAKIDLIISGVVLPGASGVHLAEHVENSKREISTLLISHFNRDLLQGMPGFSRQPEFLPNPFTPEALLIRVRDCWESLNDTAPSFGDKDHSGCRRRADGEEYSRQLPAA